MNKNEISITFVGLGLMISLIPGFGAYLFRAFPWPWQVILPNLVACLFSWTGFSLYRGSLIVHWLLIMPVVAWTSVLLVFLCILAWI